LNSKINFVLFHGGGINKRENSEENFGEAANVIKAKDMKVPVIKVIYFQKVFPKIISQARI